MAFSEMKKRIVGGMLLLAGGGFLTACVDDSYDLSQDVDLTMELGSEGLAVKLGNTERIYMNDILEVEQSNVHETASGLYYLVESGEADFSFSVDKVVTTIDHATLTPVVKVADFQSIADAVGMPATGVLTNVPAFSFESKGVHAESSHEVHLDVKRDDVASIKSIVPDNGFFTLRMEVMQESLGRYFKIDEIENLRIYLPDYIKSAAAQNGVLDLGSPAGSGQSINLGRVAIDKVEFPGEFGQSVSQGLVDIMGELAMDCDIKFSTTGGFSMQDGDYVNVRLLINVGNDREEIVVAEATGVFTPTFNPNVEPIDINASLPDFLRSEDVRVDVSNPTLRFMADMTGIPVTLDVNGVFTPIRKGTLGEPVVIPQTGTASLNKSERNLIYFYQGQEAFDPEGVNAGGEYDAPQFYKVDNIATLINEVPDLIDVDFDNGHVNVRPNTLHTIQFEHTYPAHVDYDVFIPFRFNSGLKIVYNDSITDLNEDLKDYEADGVKLTADVVNAIPLDLTARLIPVGKDGKEIPGIKVTPAAIRAGDAQGVTTPIEIAVKLENRADLKKLDMIKFRIEAAAAGQGEFTSKQWLQVKDVRIKLMGTVTADFND